MLPSSTARGPTFLVGGVCSGCRSTGGAPTRRSGAGRSAWPRAGTRAARSTARSLGGVVRAARRGRAARRPARARRPRARRRRSRCRSARTRLGGGHAPLPLHAERTAAAGRPGCSARSRRATCRRAAGRGRSRCRGTCRCSAARPRRRTGAASRPSSAAARGPWPPLAQAGVPTIVSSTWIPASFASLDRDCRSAPSRRRGRPGRSRERAVASRLRPGRPTSASCAGPGRCSVCSSGNASFAAAGRRVVEETERRALSTATPEGTGQSDEREARSAARGKTTGDDRRDLGTRIPSIRHRMIRGDF